jgi:superfamily II DNA or RNA helicase
MTLLESFTGTFTLSARERGQRYAAQGRVRIVAADDRSIVAKVRGNEVYDVTVRIDAEENLLGSCGCPYFQETMIPCKHLYATLLEAQDLPILEGRKVLAEMLEPEPFEDWEVGDFEDPTVATHPAGERRLLRSGTPVSWKVALGELDRCGPWESRSVLPARAQEILYLLEASSDGDGLVVELAYREQKKNGEWGRPRTKRMRREEIELLPDPTDRQLLSSLAGAPQIHYGYVPYEAELGRFRLGGTVLLSLLPALCGSGRCFLRDGREGLLPLTWDDRGPWELRIEVRREEGKGSYRVEGTLCRNGERISLQKPSVIAPPVVLLPPAAAPLAGAGSEWVRALRRHPTLSIPPRQADAFLEAVLGRTAVPRLELPEELRFEEARVAPRPRLKISRPRTSRPRGRLCCDLAFDYEGVIVGLEPRSHIFQRDRRRLILRDAPSEDAALARLESLGFVWSPCPGGAWKIELHPKKLPRAVRQLVEEGWHVEAEGGLLRRSSAFRLEVTTGIDWFELNGQAEFEGRAVGLPEILAALRRGEGTVRLDDGTFGLLPEEWLRRYGKLAELGTTSDAGLRFRPSQVGVLDALLASRPEVSFDAGFARLRDEIASFAGVKPLDPPASFKGALRPYQREGLGWFQFLRRFGFGGCLADDMGLGKTVQVLALLEARRVEKREVDAPRTSIVVVPRSLVFNWKEEAARFAPSLRILDHTAVDRRKPGDHFSEHDVVLTTYGILRRDAAYLCEHSFDYAILDEAEAVKNAQSESAKAARLLRARHRLVLSGTPVQNHLGELFSLFEFLNPGMLGGAPVWAQIGGEDDEGRRLLSRALRPFILRRTKVEVARELPERLEQTLICELEPEQRRAYDEIRDYYRSSVLERIAREGMERSKIHVLEALLRLRQVACHPGLVDPARREAKSAKLEMLLPQLSEVIDEGHKALVFSQFTSFLAIVRKHLDREGIAYEYLDGQTRDRAARVERFQRDEDCRLFLISLKAGGLGLNLTAAEYVFLLDPWWNPAVEAQAIDRAHRIGQDRRVFAYRLIARDTVEEKVLELQKSKRQLADAILGEDKSLIGKLTREDLELLLS